MSKAVNSFYYHIKPLIPRRLQIFFRSSIINLNRKKYSDKWPILQHANGRPKGFPGWPEQKRFALVLTHDVDTASGQAKSIKLMKLEEQLGFYSSFFFVPKRYKFDDNILNLLTKHGFEVGVHGLYHDGKLYKSKKIFEKRSIEINHYLDIWNACGFRSPSMHHHLEWIHLLNVVYDSSTFDTDPFEPQPDGCAKIYPYWIQNASKSKGYIELPYTLPQDFTVFVLMRDYNFSIWKKKLHWLVNKGAMVLLNTHPDYMSFSNEKRYDEYHAYLYHDFLEYIKNRYSDQYWLALPKDIAKFWKKILISKEESKIT